MDNRRGLVGCEDEGEEGGVGDGPDEGGGWAGIDVDADGVVAVVGQGEHQGLAQVAGGASDEDGGFVHGGGEWVYALC